MCKQRYIKTLENASKKNKNSPFIYFFLFHMCLYNLDGLYIKDCNIVCYANRYLFRIE